MSNANSVLNAEPQQAYDRYCRLVEILNDITVQTALALKDDNRWFVFGAYVAQRFLKQANTLMLLFQPVAIEYPGGLLAKSDDISSMYSILRMQFETHALYFHFFIPCKDIGENILRFRLWELDGLKARVRFQRNNITEETKELNQNDLNYIASIENGISKLSYFAALPENRQKELLKKSMWKFSTDSLKQQKREKWRLSIDQLILNTGLKRFVHDDLYSYLSMHIHPQYVGVIQAQLNDEEISSAKYVSMMNAGFVTAFMIEDLAKRYTQPKTYLQKLENTDLEMIKSVILAGRSTCSI